MDITPLHILALVVTYLGFGFLGFRLSRKIKRPVARSTWIVLIIATLLAMYVMPHIVLFGAFEFEILFSNALQAIGLGMIIGLATREIRIRVETKDSM